MEALKWIHKYNTLQIDVIRKVVSYVVGTATCLKLHRDSPLAKKRWALESIDAIARTGHSSKACHIHVSYIGHCLNYDSWILLVPSKLSMPCCRTVLPPPIHAINEPNIPKKTQVLHSSPIAEPCLEHWVLSRTQAHTLQPPPLQSVSHTWCYASRTLPSDHQQDLSE
jgi:hypothetical protein